MLSKNPVQTIATSFLISTAFLVCAFNQKSICMEEEDNNELRYSGKVLPGQNDNLLSTIHYLSVLNFQKDEEIKKLSLENKKLNEKMYETEKFLLFSLQRSQVGREEEIITTNKKESLEFNKLVLENNELKNNVNHLIEERNKLYSLTADTDGSDKIIKEMMKLLGINTDDFINCEGVRLADKCLERLKVELKTSFREKDNSFPLKGISNSIHFSNVPVEIKHSKSVSVINHSPKFSFNDWRQKLLSINTLWSKVIWEKWMISKLKSLDLYRNEITAEGGKLIGEALKFNTFLLHLNLANNRLGDEGAEAIGGALKVNTTLLTLNFNLNKIGDIGAQSLAAGLNFNTSLKSMSLRYNLFGYEGKLALNKAVDFKIDYGSNYKN